MIVVPPGEFWMGARDGEGIDAERPRHKVVIAKAFAVSKFEVRFADWDVCVEVGPCPKLSDSGFGRGKQPVINVSWDEAKLYVAWLSAMTGKPYRLLSESEWEYAARAGTDRKYSWGDEIGKGNANCDGCGSEWDNKRPAPVGAFKANAFGLHDMHGNVWEWCEDPWHDDYNGAPPDDGSVWQNGDMSLLVVRGSSWYNGPRFLPAAARDRGASPSVETTASASAWPERFSKSCILTSKAARQGFRPYHCGAAFGARQPNYHIASHLPPPRRLLRLNKAFSRISSYPPPPARR
jgi:formylglycine-generating enzyme required for sulfatase activity